MMLALNYNLAVEQTEGEYFVTLDHDDEYSPKYLEIMDELIKKYDTPQVAGVVARCQTQYGKVTPTPAYTRPLMNWFEYGKDKKGRYTGEVPRAFKTDVLKQYIPIDAKLVHNPIFEAMMSDDGYTFITTNDIIRKYYVYETAQLSITNNRSNRLAYYKYSELQKEINRYTLKYHVSYIVKMELCMAYTRAAIRYGLSFVDSINNVNRWRFSIVLLYPLSYAQVYLSSSGFIFNLWKKIRVLLDKR
jgi:glycosyltransferase involved in cell wall biosynthesis